MIQHTIECHECHAQMHMHIHNPGTKEAQEDIHAAAKQNGFAFRQIYEPEGGYSELDGMPLGNEVLRGVFFCSAHHTKESEVK